MINTYGLFWEREEVFWGWPGVNGTLLGADGETAGARIEDFREQRGIYALYADYELVYIGQAGGGTDDRLFKRLKSHHQKGRLVGRWNQFSWFGINKVREMTGGLAADVIEIRNLDVPTALNILEAISMEIAEPRLNRQGGKWGDAVQYYQCRDERLDEEEEPDE